MTALPETITREQIAESLHMTPPGVRALELRDSSFPRGTKVGRRIVYARAAYDAWFERRFESSARAVPRTKIDRRTQREKFEAILRRQELEQQALAA